MVKRVQQSSRCHACNLANNDTLLHEDPEDYQSTAGCDGRIALRGGPGPFGFKPKELEHAILTELGG